VADILSIDDVVICRGSNNNDLRDEFSGASPAASKKTQNPVGDTETPAMDDFVLESEGAEAFNRRLLLLVLFDMDLFLFHDGPSRERRNACDCRRSNSNRKGSLRPTILNC